MLIEAQDWKVAPLLQDDTARLTAGNVVQIMDLQPYILSEFCGLASITNTDYKNQVPSD